MSRPEPTLQAPWMPATSVAFPSSAEITIPRDGPAPAPELRWWAAPVSVGSGAVVSSPHTRHASAPGAPGTLVLPDGSGSFDAVMSRVATVLETASRRCHDAVHRPDVVDDNAMAGALVRTGLDERLVASVAEGLRHGAGLEALLLEAFGSLLPAPPVPRRAGSLLVVVGAGAPARRLAAAVAADIGIDPAEVPFASRDGAAHAVVTGRLLVRSAEDAAELAPGWRRSRAAVVVVDAAVTGPGRPWATHLIAALRPTAVWGVVDATAKAEDIAAWAEALGGIDALALEDLEATVSPASSLGVGIPVARIDGQPATAARWVAAIVDRVTPCT